MKKRDKIKLLVKEKTFRVVLWYLTLFTTVQLTGNFQNIFNHKAVKQYKEIVNDFGCYLSDNGIEDPTQIFDYFNYALWGGYLSHDHSFQFNQDRDIFFSSYGIGCVLGDSVCLNNAAMLSDLYKSMGMDSDILMCYVPAGKVSIDEIRNQDEITRNVVGETVSSQDNFVIVNPLALLFGNHVITIVNNDGEYFYYDPTNLAYLSKKDMFNLEVINGAGSFKQRDLTTFVFEFDAALKDLLATKQREYNLTYLNSLEETSIDPLKLEEFYISEKELIDSVYDSIKSKSQMMIKILSLVLAGILVTLGQIGLDKVMLLKSKKEEDKLKDIITLFMRDVGIEKFEEVCSYLYYLINGGYLTIDDDNNLTIKASVILPSSALVTLDKDYGKSFFNEYLKSQFIGVQVIKGKDVNNVESDFYIYKDQDEYKIYSWRGNLMCQVSEDNKFVNSLGEYKIIKIFKSKYKNKVKVNDVDIDYKFLSSFEDTCKPVVEEVAHSFAYVPKK